MTEPIAQRPVPGPLRPGPSPTPAPVPATGTTQAQESRAPQPGAPEPGPATRLTGLEGLPVAEHVAVFEAEHQRLQRELGTIDPL